MKKLLSLIPLLSLFILIKCSTQKNIPPKYQSENLKIEKLSKNTFVHISYLKEYNNFPCNGLVFYDSGEAIIFDSPTENRASKELIDWVKNELNCEIKAIVVNHFHIDCLGGLKEFHENDIPSYANNMTLKLANSPKAHNNTVPKIGFDDSLHLTVGNKIVENKYFGQGHSSDNIVSYIPSEKTMFGGCMIKALNARKGNLKDANVKEWSNTVAKVKLEYAENLKFIVPGHGKPGGTDLLDYTIELFKEK